MAVRALSSRSTPLDEAFSLSDTCALANCSSPRQVNTSSLTAACRVQVFQKYPDTSFYGQAVVGRAACLSALGKDDEAMAVARRLRTGMVHLNGADTDVHAPFGGYKQSGYGRDLGVQAALEKYTQTK